MKKIILAVAVAAVAIMAVASAASADVARYQTQTATFTAIQPYGAVGQWQNVWTHKYTVTVNPCDGMFTGTGIQYDNHMVLTNTEKVTGNFGAGTVTLNAVRDDSVSWTLTNPLDGTVTLANSLPVVPWVLEFKVSAPTMIDLTHVKNHGEYVSAQPDKNDAAHSCIGMPIH